MSFNKKSQFLIFAFAATLFLAACSERKSPREEEVRALEPTVTDDTDTASRNSIRGNLSFTEILTNPNRVVLTGLPQHRLVTIYKSGSGSTEEYYKRKRDYYDDGESEYESHYMPGIDVIYGYNLLNVAHYDLVTEQVNYLFDHPVLVKTLYYPSFEQDSIDKKPINRNYYMVSVYDKDTNADTLINRKDLRRLYHFNASSTEKMQLIPDNYSVVRSQYDAMNDVMYVFARHDANNNGRIERKEPQHIFWLRLKSPEKAKRLY